MDVADGEADEQWRGHDFPSNIVATPALAAWQNRIIQALIEREGFGDDDITDLPVNYKAPDSLGHIYNMISARRKPTPSVRSTTRSARWSSSWIRRSAKASGCMILTADHGQTPLKAGGWPISRSEIKLDIDRTSVSAQTTSP